ncbi:MAG: cytochrome c oxidase assembly protein, partial [Candidatus Omnitrophica bacterium]|nr:cytochrome c oxidase assembly protein [Candidatus Omnitrophota bacterium]
MTTWELFKSAWDWEPSVLAGTVLLLSGYLAAVRCRINRRTLYFVSGVVVMVLALVSPLDTLGDDYLFSAHMLQHILLDMVAPPLFVLGLPVELVRRLLRWRPAAMLERMLGRPAVAWILGIGTLWLWHLPYLYDLTLENENIHIAEHLSFLVTGTIFWWPAFSPLSERRLPALTSVVYLTCGALASGLLGIIFTLSSTPFYSGYLHPKDELGALSLIRNQWGLDPVTDQQLGGAFMWVIGSFIFLWAIVAQVVHWYGESETEADTASTAAGRG